MVENIYCNTVVVGTFSVFYSRKTSIHLVCLKAQGVSFQNQFSEGTGLLEEQEVSCTTSHSYLNTLCIASGRGWAVTIEDVHFVIGRGVVFYLNISSHGVSHLFQKFFLHE